MTPGIQPSNVKIMLRKKLAIRPVMSTASGGKTTQKKYRSAFITNFSSSPSSYSSGVGRLLAIYRSLAFSYDSSPRPSSARNLPSPGSTADHRKDDANTSQNLANFLISDHECSPWEERREKLALKTPAFVWERTRSNRDKLQAKERPHPQPKPAERRLRDRASGIHQRAWGSRKTVPADDADRR